MIIEGLKFQLLASRSVQKIYSDIIKINEKLDIPSHILFTIVSRALLNYFFGKEWTILLGL